jgi:hypothetical protein
MATEKQSPVDHWKLIDREIKSDTHIFIFITGWCITSRNVRVYHSFNYGTHTNILCIFKIRFFSLSSYILDWFYYFNKSLNLYPLYCLPEDGTVSGRNMQEVIVCKNYFTSLYFVGITILLYIQLMHGFWIT